MVRQRKKIEAKRTKVADADADADQLPGKKLKVDALAEYACAWRLRTPARHATPLGERHARGLKAEGDTTGCMRVDLGLLWIRAYS